jgi:hypothetical protein
LPRDDIFPTFLLQPSGQQITSLQSARSRAIAYVSRRHAMPIIHVTKPFIFHHDPTTPEAIEGEKQFFGVGEHEVAEHIAEHWYVKHHLEGFVDPLPVLGQADYAQKMLTAARAARNTTSVADAQPPPAPLPPGVTPAPETHYFAGTKQEDAPLPPAPAWMTGRAP